MSIAAVVAVVSTLLVLIGLAEPVAKRLKLPFPVVLAVLGIGIATVSAFLMHAQLSPGLNMAAGAVSRFPVHSQLFLVVFLPLLLFQTAINIDARPMLGDAGPIFVLAVVAVVVATFVIGFALWPLAGMPLAACLLLGSVVATTDPVAVVGIFRDLGAPARLRRLVEGESLLNDAAAIALFILFLSLLTGVSSASPVQIGAHFIGGLAGGALFGWIMAALALRMVPPISDIPPALVSLSLALAYLSHSIAESLGLSGVVAVVAAGLTLNLLGPSRIEPSCWGYLRAMWEQLDYWASALVFVLAALLVPRLLHGLGWSDLVLLGVLVVAATVARGLIVFGALPLLSRLRLSLPIGRAHGAVMLWGGMRGAMTLALALSIIEAGALPVEIQRFVAVLATGFVLFTLLVQATTLRPLILSLGLDRLGPQDMHLRREVLRNVRLSVAQASRSIAEKYGLRALDEVRDIGPPGSEGPAGGGDEVVAGAVFSLARRERELVMAHFADHTVSKSLVARMLSDAEILADRTRSEGVAGYTAASERQLRFPVRFRLARLLQRYAGRHALLTKAVAERFELLTVRRMILSDLAQFILQTMEPIVHEKAAQALVSMIAERRESVGRALEALRLQYPAYAGQLERYFLRKATLRLEEREYDRLRDEGMIGPEVYDDLRREIALQRDEAAHRPRLDLELDTPTLMRSLPMLSALSLDDLEAVGRMMRPVFALPGDVLMRKGEKGDAAYFIASGAVEVAAPNGSVRLGRGEVFGELALLTDAPRSADVTSIAYCSLLRLSRLDFQRFLDGNLEASAQIRAVADTRLRENQANGLRSRA